MTAVQRWTGHEATALRNAMRLSVRRFADHLGVSVGTVAGWSRRGGDIELTSELQSVMDTALARATEDVRRRFEASLTSETSLVSVLPAVKNALVADQLERLRQEVHDSIASGTVSVGGIDDWELLVLNHGRSTRYRPAGELLRELSADCTELQRMLRLNHSATTSRSLTRIMAQLAGLISLTLIRLGQQAASGNWARTARLAATEAGDPALSSWVRAQEAYTAFYSDDIPGTVQAARHAEALAGRIPCVGVALATALAARAHGLLGQTRDAHQALERAHHVLSLLSGEDLAPSAFGYNEAQLAFHEGNALTHLHDSASAWQAQQRALQLYAPDDFMDRALVRLDRSANLLHDGEPEAAAQQAITVLIELAPGQREGIVSHRAAQILAMLAPAQAHLPAARELRDVLVADSDRHHD